MNAVTKVYDIMKATGRAPAVCHTGDFGVEIETETQDKYPYPTLKFWEAKKDNSLRDYGCEYVLKVPMDVPSLEKALHEFSLCDKKFKFRNSSISTSVHVHVNFLNSTYLAVANFLTAWTLVENVLIRYSGPDRLSNLFCLPIRDCEGIVDKWVHLLGLLTRANFGKANLNPEQVKYSALNAATLSTLGTLEVRTFRGETDISVIQRWVEIIQKLKNFSEQKDVTPPYIMNLFKEHGTNIINLIFQEYAKEFQYKDLDKLIDMSQAFHAAKIASVSKDWSKFGVLKVKPVYKEKIKDDLEKISQQVAGGSFDQLQYHERLMVLEYYQRMNGNVRVVDAPGDI